MPEAKEKKVHLRIVTPTAVKIDEKVDMVIMNGTDGAVGVMPGHMPMSLTLEYGITRILNDNYERRIAVFGGIAQVKDNVLSILANTAEWPEDIDVSRAEAVLDEARKDLRMQGDSAQIQRSQVMMRRSLVEIEVSSYTVVGQPKSSQ